MPAAQLKGGEKSLVNVWICGLFLLTAFTSCTTALTRPFWNDEILTAAVVHLKTFSKMWDALQNGADAQPPVFYWISTWLTPAPRQPEFWLRVPAIVGFLMLLVSAFLFVARAKGPAAAIVSAAVLISSEGLYYASEARPYGALLGCLGLAALLWQSRKRGNQSSATLIAFVFVLTVACALHYFGIFAVFIFGLAELYLAITSRRPDWKVLFSLPVTLVPIICAERLIRGDHNQYASAFWAHPSWRTFVGAYKFTFSLPTLNFGTLFRFHGVSINLGHLLPAAFLLLVLGALFFRARRPDIPLTPNVRSVPPEIVLAVGFLSLPALIGAASLVTGAFTERYAIGSLLGTAVLFGWALATLNHRLSYAVACALTLVFLLHQTLPDIQRLADLTHGQTPTVTARAVFAPIFRHARSGEPIVIPDGHLFLEANRYADAGSRRDLVYLQDHALALQFAGTDTLEGTNDGIRPYFDIRLEPPIPFLATHPKFLMATRVSGGWLGTYLRCAGARIERLEANAQDVKIFAVNLPAPLAENRLRAGGSANQHSACSGDRVDTEFGDSSSVAQ